VTKFHPVEQTAARTVSAFRLVSRVATHSSAPRDSANHVLDSSPYCCVFQHSLVTTVSAALKKEDRGLEGNTPSI
jgi:hypothetical protein